MAKKRLFPFDLRDIIIFQNKFKYKMLDKIVLMG